MRKFFAFFIVSILYWGVVSAQTPDVPQGVVCAFPTVLDTLTGETPVCPTLGMPTVAFSETDPNRLVFTTPILGGTVLDGMQAKFKITVGGVSGTFYTNASLNTDNTKLLGGVTITGDAALQGLDLRGKTLYVAAQITGCHAADATDPTSSTGIVTETASFVVPLPCPAFYDTKDTISGATYRMISHIQLGSPYQYQNRYFVVKEGGDSLTITATYNSNFEYRSIGLPTSYWQGKIITFYPVLDVKCGSDMSTYVKIVGPSFTRSFIQCPELGNISLHSNHSSNPYLRKDTLFVTVSNYSAAAVAGLGVTVTPQGASSSVNWTLDQWTANHNAAYKVLTLAELQQLGLSNANLTASVTANLTVTPGAQGCSNASVSGQIVLPGLPECPAFAPNATTVVTQQGNSILLATTSLLHYNPALIHHTGVAGQDSLYYTLYVNTTDTTHAGALVGSYAAVYDAQTQTMTLTLSPNQVTFGARYDFVPHVNLTGYCNSASDAPITIDGPAGYVVPVLRCPSYGPTTTAVRNPDGSVTVTHQLVDYNPVLMSSQAMPRVFAADSNGVSFKTSSNVLISSDGLLTCIFPASDLTTRPSHNVSFRPRIVLSDTFCTTQPGFGPASNRVCLPYTNLPTLTAVSNTDGMGKVNLFKNEGVILKTKVSGSGNFSLNHVVQAGFLLSREPITEYSADKAVVGAFGGTTGDTLSYKVGMDSCGGVTYYRPYVILGGCDPHTVLGPQSSFEMWAPDFTVSANPTHVAAGGSVTLTAVATMTVGTWNSQTSYGIPCQEIPPIANNTCGLPYTDDCSTTKNMEVWMYLLVGLRSCPSFWNSFHGMIYNALGMDPGNADFRYRWERNGSTFFSTTSHSAPGVTTDTPTATTEYTGVADFSYNGVHCVQKRKITVAVP
jgi:hypothetical protein